jgi:hypothetical protein
MSALRTRRKSNLELWIERVIDDHGVWPLLFALVTVLVFVTASAWSLGGAQRPSLHYSYEGLRLLWLEFLGGTQQIDRAVEIHDELTSFDDVSYNGLDIEATTLYVTGTTFKKNQFEAILKRPQGRVRILVLDPRLADRPSEVDKFKYLAESFDNTPEVLLAECRLTAATLLQLRTQLSSFGDQFAVRFYSRPANGAPKGQFLLGRSYHRYSIAQPERRFDLIVPYGQQSENGIDSPSRKAFRSKDRPNDPVVQQYVASFDQLWAGATPIEDIMQPFRDPSSPNEKRQ